MLKKSIFILLWTLLMTGCVERGQNVTPQYIAPITNSSADKNNTVVQPLYVLKCSPKDREIDKTQNAISGAMLLAIGIIILL